MSIKTVLFDLDGTLLPLDQDRFIKEYFGRLAKKLAPHGYDPDKLIKAIWAGTVAMVKNDGSKLNEEAFWDYFVTQFGEGSREDIPIFDDFYHNEFNGVKDVCGHSPLADEAVKKLKAKGKRVALATNPLFPAVATENRIRWAGLDRDDFELYTTYENSHYCKPNPEYYREILDKLGANACECLMVGNDVREDMIAETLGMKVFLLTDCIINKDDSDISRYPQGGFDELLKFIDNLE
ncbi:MAG: HAD family hydrolase [Clostridia bacterium]|nr:HAD family hydrolase [Clostridia bacterium]